MTSLEGSSGQRLESTISITASHSPLAIKLYQHIKERLPLTKQLIQTGFLTFPSNGDYRIQDLNIPSNNNDISHLRRTLARRSFAIDYNNYTNACGFLDRIHLYASHTTLRETSRPTNIDDFVKDYDLSHHKKLIEAIQVGLKSCVLERHLGSFGSIVVYRSLTVLRDTGFEHLFGVACLLKEDQEYCDCILAGADKWSTKCLQAYECSRWKFEIASPWLGLPSVHRSSSLLATTTP